MNLLILFIIVYSYVSEILYRNRKHNSKIYLLLTIFRFDA